MNSPSRKFTDKPPTPKHNRSATDGGKGKSENKNLKQVLIQDIDTSVSDNCYHSDEKNQNDIDSSDSTNPGRSRKKLFSR